MNRRIKIRGIYSTALTKFLLDSGYEIADPSSEIQERISFSPAHRSPEILVKDLNGHQGVEIIGEADALWGLLADLENPLLDMALLYFDILPEPERDFYTELEGARELSHARLEFGWESKKTLDIFRSSIMPSLGLHHRLRIINPKRLEKAEKQLGKEPRLKENLERILFEETILLPLSKAETIRLEHVKISGKPVRLREGVLLEMKEDRILLKRSFSGGRYDGLRLPIDAGDYSLTEIQEGAWFVNHAYYTKEGRLKGQYYNINTPVELYPYGARYIDLEIDVVRRPGEAPLMVDREDLSVLARSGRIGNRLEQKALEVGEDLLEKLRSGDEEMEPPPRPL